ncbi:MAG: signal transduction histidine kinase/CheY-like chemotaxis protein [Cognaticolwellia sp.]|jgi:signal transduction histidine kinase/CheY-like chemotaxis protein
MQMKHADSPTPDSSDSPPAPWGVRFPTIFGELDSADHKLLLRRSVSDLERRVPVSLYTYVLLFGVLVLHPSLRAMTVFWVAMACTLGLTLLRGWVGRYLGDVLLSRALDAQKVFVLLTVLQGVVWGSGVVAATWWNYPGEMAGILVLLTTTGIAGGSLGTFTFSMRCNALYQLLLSLPLLVALAVQTAQGLPEVWMLGALILVFIGFLLFQGRRLEKEYWHSEINRLIVARKHVELVAARERAEQAALAKGVFLSTMSHELRTPLNGVLGMVDLLRSSPMNREQDHYLRTIGSAGNALLGLIDDILDTVRLERGVLPLYNKEFAPSDVVDEVLSCLAPVAWQKGIQLAGVVQATLPSRLWGDPARLRQVLINLVGNAIKFTEHGQVTLRVGSAGRLEDGVRLRLEVEDSGVGLEGLDLELLFCVFEQGDQGAARQHGGSGLGLRICRGLVEQMKGEIGAKDRVGPGAIFWAEIPLKKAQLRGLEPLLPWTRAWIEEPYPDSASALESILLAYGVRRCVQKDAQVCFLSFPCAPERLAALSIPVVLLADGPQLADARRLGGDFGARVLLRPLRRCDVLEVVLGAPARPDTFDLVDASLRVLLVEDNPVNELVARRFLEREGLRCEVARDGLEALELVKNKAWDLVLMDCQMPRMDGFDATLAIRAWEKARRLSPVAIVALTANTTEADRERCATVGMDAFLPKPLRREALCEVLASLAAKGVLSDQTEASV